MKPLLKLWGLLPESYQEDWGHAVRMSNIRMRRLIGWLLVDYWSMIGRILVVGLLVDF
jgi:hypothetical protein